MPDTPATDESSETPVVYVPGGDGTPVHLFTDPTRFTVAFGTDRTPLSPEAAALLRKHSAPIAQFPRYGIHVYENPSEGELDLLNRERAVELAAPVLHRHTPDGDEVYVTRYVLVQFWPEVGRQQIDTVLETMHAQIVQALDYAANGFRLLAPPDVGGLGAFRLANALRATGLTMFAHPDLVSQRHRRTATLTAESTIKNAPSTRAGDYLSRQWHLDAAHVTDAWSLTRGSPSIRIAILDDGVDISHPEFDGRVVAQRDFTTGATDGTPKSDDDKHGTACAGVAAAAGARACGAAPACSLMAVRFPAVLGDSDEADMFRWTADNGADVISCSWGPADGTGQSDPLPGSTQAAIHYCLTNGRGGKGIPICWAAGNGDESVDLDGYASNPDVIAVAASNDRSVRSWYSDHGDAVWICAPSSGDRAAGEKAITTTDRQGSAGYNDGSEGLDANYTNSFGGTSSASPLTAGVIALMLSANPQMTAEEVRIALRDSARKIGSGYDSTGHSAEYGYGLIDAYQAVLHAQAAAQNYTPPSIIGPSSYNRADAAPQFEIDPGTGPAIYYAVEVATDASHLDGGEHSLDARFYASWQDTPFLSSNPYTLPTAVWQRLRTADSIYYRAFFSTSNQSWEGVVVTTADTATSQAPRVQLVGDVSGSRTRQAPSTRDTLTPTHAGFDRLAYPGDDVMRSLYANTNLAWTGFYLAPAPSQSNTSWMTKAQLLRDIGWGLAPIFVGQQWPGGPGSHVLTKDQGTADAAQAISLADTADIGDNSVIYLDIEIGGRLPAAYLDYCQAWFDGIRESKYRPGVYCSYLDTPTQLREKNPDLYFWVFNINKFTKTQYLNPDESFRAASVDQSGCAFATAWQYIQGAPSIPVSAGVDLNTVDMDTSIVLDPSHPDTPTPPSPEATSATPPTITTSSSTVEPDGPAPQFILDPGDGSLAMYYAVEVATDAALLDGGDHGLGDGFYGSWRDAPLLSSNPYQLPDPVWRALNSAERLYFRGLFSTSSTEWIDIRATTGDADWRSAPSMTITSAGPAERDLRNGIRQPIHPAITGPAAIARGNTPPVFVVSLTPTARSWRLEIASRTDLFDDNSISERTTSNFWASEILGANVRSAAMQADGWLPLQHAERLYYRACVCPSAPGQSWYCQDSSTPPQQAPSAPWVDVHPDDDRTRSVAEGPTHVTDSDELHWRTRRDAPDSETALAVADLANDSDIAAYEWIDRGVAPRGYLRGMAVMFGRVYCKMNAGRDAASEMSMADSGDGATDALAWYATEFDDLGMDNSTAGVDVLRHLFVLLTGLGMRESSGKYCEGRDTTATNTTADTAEAGLFQVSYNSRRAHFLLEALFDEYKGSTDFVDIFSEGVSCGAASWQDFGVGEGRDFQALTKACPAFAVEYAALALRKVRKHWGPINRKTAELRPECDELFKSVCEYIDQNGITEV